MYGAFLVRRAPHTQCFPVLAVTADSYMYSRLDLRRFAFFLWLGTSGLHAKTQQSKRIPCRYTIEQQEFLFTYLRLPLGNGASPTGSAGTGTLFGLFAAVVGLVRPVGLLITVGE